MSFHLMNQCAFGYRLFCWKKKITRRRGLLFIGQNALFMGTVQEALVQKKKKKKQMQENPNKALSKIFQYNFATIIQSHQFISLEKNTSFCQLSLLYLFNCLFVYSHSLLIFPYFFSARGVQKLEINIIGYIPLMKRLEINSINRD